MKCGDQIKRNSLRTPMRLQKEGSHCLENPKPYEVEITTSREGEHYQITLKPDVNDKSTWCKAAAFSDDAGVIFLGAALDCDASAK